MAENDKTVIHTTEGGGGAGWFVAVLLLLLVAAGAYYFANGGFTSRETIDIEVTVPEVPEAPATDGGSN